MTRVALTPLALLLPPLLSLATLLLLSGALLADGELARAREARAAFLGSDQERERASWQRLITQFEQAAKVQPRVHYRTLANLEAAQLAMRSHYRFKSKDDAAKAQRLARSVLKDCPRCEAAPGALLVLGRSLAAAGRLDDAYRELMKVELSHPDSPEVAEARGIMSSLRAGNSPAPYPPGDTGASGAGAASAASPPKAQGPARPARPRPSLKTPVNPPVKAPPPRKDGLAQVYAYSLTDMGEYSVVTAWLDQVTPYVYNLVPPARSGGSYRVYVDLRDARQAPGLAAKLKNSSRLVQLVKANQFDQKTVRLVADLKEPYPYQPTFLDNPPRMELLISDDPGLMPPREADAQPQPRAGGSKPPRRPSDIRPTKGPADSLARQLGLKIRKVVIDPGHGGKDGGASGFGLKEKDIALRASKMLATKIRSRLGLEVLLTRDTDKFVTLDRRGKIVVDNKGDIFISIHANSNGIASVEGIETYILNFGTDPSAMTVAARENASWDKSMSELSGILDQLAKNTKVAESRVMAKSIHQGALSQLRSKYKVRDLGVKEAVFVVLLNTDVPAVLIEMGFLSNQGEAKRLNDDAYLELMTDGIVDGLAAYIAGLPR